MAGRVNVKFVTFLVIGVVLMLGGVVGAYVFVFDKSGDDWARMAREAEAAGEQEDAVTAWGRAVGHEPQNVEWLRSWLAVMEATAPPLQREYGDRFQLAQEARRALGLALASDFDASVAYLDRLYRQFASAERAGRETAQFVIQRVEEAMLPYETLGDSAPSGWERLRRYRGLSWRLVAARGGSLSEDERAEAVADLDAAIAAAPDDGESVASLARLRWDEAVEELRGERQVQYEALRDEVRRLIAELESVAPANEWLAVEGLSLAFEIERVESGIPAMTGAAARTAVMALADQFSPRLDDTHRTLLSSASRLDDQVLLRFQTLELLLSRGSNLAQSLELYESQLAVAPGDPLLMIQRARVLASRGDVEDAVGVLNAVRALDSKPLSLTGLLQFDRKRFAAQLTAEYQVQLATQADDDAARDAAIASAEAALEEYETMAGSNDPRILFLRGVIASASDDLLGAIGPLREYNERTLDRDPSGLWAAGRTALRLNRSTEAKETFEKLLAVSPADTRAMFALAEVEQTLSRRAAQGEQEAFLRRAIAQLRNVMQVVPEGDDRFAAAAERLAALEITVGDQQADDPVITVLLEAQSLAGAGDRPEAIDLLLTAFDDESFEFAAFTGNAPRVALSAVLFMMQEGRLEEAQALIRRAQAANPDDASLASIRGLLDADDVPSAYVALIEDGGASDAQKEIQKFNVFRQYDMQEEASAALARALEIEPDNASALDLAFVRALRSDDLDAATELAEQAEEFDADGLGGLTYAARLASANEDYERSARLLREATASRSADATIFRMLGIEERRLGNEEASLAAFDAALSIRETDGGTVREYVRQLWRMNRRPEALEAAIRLRAYGAGDPEFEELYITLLSQEGGEDGRREAIRLRRQRAAANPADGQNKFRLAALYIDDRQWLEARSIIDELRAQGDDLRLVLLDAQWHADQGRVQTEDGTADGLNKAIEVFVRYIVSQPEEQDQAETYLTLAQFLIPRGRYERALNAIRSAKPLQDQATLPAEKLEARMWMQLGRYQQAVEPLTAIVDGGADEEGQAWLERLVESLILQERFDEAESRLAGYTPERRDGLIALLQRADVAAGTGDLDGALEIADEAVRGFQEESVAFVKRAQLLLARDERLLDAEADLATATELNPTDWRSWRILAAVQFRRGDTESAIDALRRVVELNPTNNEVILGLIVELIRQEDDGEALSVALEVIERRQRDVSLMLSVANAFSERGLWGRSSAVMDRAWTLTRSPSIAVGYVDTLINQTPPNVARADQVLSQVTTADPDAAAQDTLLIARALVEQARGNPRRAASFIGQAFDAITPERYQDPAALARQHLNWYTNLLRLYREDGTAEARRVAQEMYDARRTDALAEPWLLFTLARIDFVIDEAASSEVARERMLGIARDTSNQLVARLAYRGLGASLYNEDDFQAAADVWTEALEAYPDDWEMLNNLAFTLAAELGRPADGLEVAERAVAAAPERAQSYDTKARVLIQLGRAEEALEALGQAEYRIQRSRTRLNVMMNRARAFVLLGEISRAEQMLNQVRTSLQTLPDLEDDFEEAIAEVEASMAGSPVGAAGG